MKKQILLLVLTFCALTTVLGQMKAGSAPQPLIGCTNDALHPLAGVSYNYKTLVTPEGGNFQWWATKDFDFIKAGANNSGTKLTVASGDLLKVSDNYGIKGGATNADVVTITWSSAALAATTGAAPTFVVMQSDATGTNCSNNLKVYQINPVNGFTVDIKNMDQSKVAVTNYSDTYSSYSELPGCKSFNGASAEGITI